MRRVLLALMLLAGCSRQPAADGGPHQIRLVGASAGLPFAEDVAERFTLASADAIAPLAQADGTASGIARFCGGIGGGHPDLAIATRAMTAAERRGCTAHGVETVLEVRFGWSAPVLIAGPGAVPRALTVGQAAAAISGSATRWSDVAAELPATPILLYGPAHAASAGDGLGWWRAIRHDSAYHPLGADAALVADTVARTPGAVGLVPFAQARLPGLRAIAIDGVAPTAAAIASGRYPARVPLILLVKPDAVRGAAGLATLLRMFAASIDPGGPFARAGLVPLDDAGRAAAKGAIGHAAIL